MSNLKKPTFLCLHHTGLSHSKNPNQFYSNNNYHKALWQFKSSLGYYLGYNYEISKRSTVTVVGPNKTVHYIHGSFMYSHCL